MPRTPIRPLPRLIFMARWLVSAVAIAAVDRIMPAGKPRAERAHGGASDAH